MPSIWPNALLKMKNLHKTLWIRSDRDETLPTHRGDQKKTKIYTPKPSTNSKRTIFL